MKAKRLLLLTDVAGVLDKGDTLVDAALDRGGARADSRRHHQRRHDPENRGLHRGGGSRASRRSWSSTGACHIACCWSFSPSTASARWSAARRRRRLEWSASHSAPRNFERTQVWIFDLDNTLYPAECNLFAQVDQRWASSSPAFSACPSSTRGTCRRPTIASSAPRLSGLMQVHRMDPKPFLDYVHDLDLSGGRRASRAGGAHRASAGPQADLHQRLARACRARGGQARRSCICFEASLIFAMPITCPSPLPACYEHFLRVHGVERAAIGDVRGHTAATWRPRMRWA